MTVYHGLRQTQALSACPGPASAETLPCAALTGFRYLMAYDTEADPPHIVRVVDTARDLPAALRDFGLDGL